MTRETIKEYILQVKSQDGTEALYNRWEPDILVEVINEIFNDHEVLLKEAYELKSIAYDLLLEAIQLKDEEIERLKADKECAKDVINWHEKECKQYIKLHHTKARSIVAMLFWEWRKSKARIYATNIKWKIGRAFQSQILFEAAYKILKEQQ